MNDEKAIAAVSGPGLPSISVVIRTFNSGKTLAQVLERLDFTPGDELLVVDSGSTDSTLAIAERFGARVIRSSQPFHYSRALNAGFNEARNAWVLSLSSHSIPVDARLLWHYRDAVSRGTSEIACVTGDACLHVESNRQPAATRVCTPSDYRSGNYFRVSNTNCLYRKSVWERHHFDENIEIAEDAEWSIWAYAHGYSLMSCPCAIVLYRSRMSYSNTVRKGYREGRVLRRLSLCPCLSLPWLVRHCFWLAISPLRGKLPFSAAGRRICYAVGDYLGRRSEAGNAKRDL